MEKEIKKKETKKVEKKEIKKSTTAKKTTTTKKSTTPKKKETTKKVESKKTTPAKKPATRKPETKKKTLAKTSAINNAPKTLESNTREIDIKELKKIVEEEKAKEIRIPDLEGKKVEDGKKILEEKNIKYEEETEKVYSLKIGKGKIVKTEPEKGKEYKDKKIVIYESRSKALMLIIALVLLVVGLTGLTYGRDILESLSEQFIKTGIREPKVDLEGFYDEEGKPMWTTENVIRIQNPDKKIEKYKYCIRKTKDKKKCEWKETDIPVIEIPESGHIYITIIGIGPEGKEGKPGEIEVYIDKEGPKVDSLIAIEVTETTIKVETKATDKLSGIDKYMYSIDGKTFIEDGIHP